MQNQINSMLGSFGEAAFRGMAIKSLREQKEVQVDQLKTTAAISKGDVKSVDDIIAKYQQNLATWSPEKKVRVKEALHKDISMLSVNDINNLDKNINERFQEENK